MEDKNNEKIESFEKLLSSVRKAQRRYSKYSQEKVDAIFKAVALAADKASYRLAKEAVSETGMGNVEDKLIKNKYAAEFIYDQYKDSKTAGVIEQKGSYMKVAEPLGVLGAVVPTTNPTSTAIFKILLALKTRNAIIFSPHPRAKKCTIDAIRTCYRAAVEAGAPRNIIGWIEEPSVETSKLLMKECDCTLATGGPGMVLSAYSSGKPALGVGPGNVPVVIDSSADLDMAAASIVHSKTFDNGTICASEQNCIVVSKVYDAFKQSLTKYGAYIIPEYDMDKVRKVIMIPSRNNPNVCSVNPSIVGKTAMEIAKICQIDVPFGTKILVGEIPSFNPEEGFAKEKLSPILSLIPATNFRKAVDIAEDVAEHGGHGHTAALYVDRNQERKIEYFGQKLETCRILINMPSSQGAIGGIYTEALPPSLTLGCGSWGGNSIYENLGIDNLLNIKTVAIRKIKKTKLVAPEFVVYKDDSIKSCAHMAKKNHKVGILPLIVNDEFSERAKDIAQRFEKEGFEVRLFSVRENDFTVENAKNMATEISKVATSDLMLASGYDAEIDFAKLVRLFMNDPNADLELLSMPAIAKSKRIVQYPKNKQHLMVFPLDEFMNQAVTNDIISVKGEKGMIHLADNSLMPEVICMDDRIFSSHEESVMSNVVYLLSRTLSAAVSLNANESTDELCMQTLNAFACLFPTDVNHGQQILEIDSDLAGVAYSTTGGSLLEALSFAIARQFDKSVIDVQNVIFPHVIEFMADDCKKMGTSNVYVMPDVCTKLYEITELLDLDISEDVEISARILARSLEKFKVKCGVGERLEDIGISIKDLKSKAHDIALGTFGDQCMMSSPVYPTIDDLTRFIKKL